MTEAKISISRICSDPDTLAVRRRETKAVLDSGEAVFAEEERLRAKHKQEEHAFAECVHLIAQSVHASLA
jgi:hypothetical protein